MLKNFSVPLLIVLLLSLWPGIVDSQTHDTSSIYYSRPLELQSITTSLSALPEADTLIYFSPRRILNDVAPKLLPQTEVEKMRANFEEIKKSIGVDPSKLDYATIGIRFHKPTAELNFVPPDFLIVAAGDLGADALATMARLYLQDKARDEKYGSKTITFVKIDDIAAASEKNPILKSFVEPGLVALTPTTIAIGNGPYLKAAIDAIDGKGRISETVIASLLRDPNALISVAGSPLAALTRSIGMRGTETTPRASTCETKFGDFYGAVSLDNNIFRLRGALNADNPDTAKILSNLVLSLWPVATSTMTADDTQALMKLLKLEPREDEVIVEADIPQDTVVKFIHQQMTPPRPATPAAATTPAKKPVHKRRQVRKKS